MTSLASVARRAPANRCSSSLTVDVLGPLPADQLLILILSERRLQGSRNEEDRKLNTRPPHPPPQHIIKLFFHYSREYKTQEKKGHSVWNSQVWGGFTGQDLQILFMSR